MDWRRNFSLRSYLRSTMWLVPVVAFIVSIVAIRLLGAFDVWLGWDWEWKIDVAIVQMTLQALIATVVSFIVFAFGSLLVAIQIASAQLTPRIIATTLLRDNTLRLIVALFVLTFSFSLGTLVRSQTDVHYLLLTCAVLLGCSSMVAFIYLIDYAARLLRPVTIVWRLGEGGLAVIEQVYPTKLKGDYKLTEPCPTMGPADSVIYHRGKSGIILAVDLKSLLREAERTGGVIEFQHQIGNFLSVDEPLFLLYGGAVKVDERRLRSAVALGRERTIEQDPTFSFRVIVDIAVKVASDAVHDPTTAVLAIDQLHRLLRAVGRRRLHDDVVRDAAGAPRVIFRTPDWRDFVEVSCREIRLYGAHNYQVARRLRAMLENLAETLPEFRRDALFKEVSLLDQTLERLGMLPDDLELARIPDLQGLGAPLRLPPIKPA